MVFGTLTTNSPDTSDDLKSSPLSNGAKNYFSERENGRKSPVDLPLRLDDAAASPTIPQGQQQKEFNLELRRGAAAAPGDQ
jgi:hypothetical protein